MNMANVNKQNTPLYSQIREYIRIMIKEGKLKPGEKIPTQAELAENFKASLITSRRAIVDLEREGLIYTIQGKGSFVKEPVNSDTNSTSNKLRLVAVVLPYIKENGFDIVNGIEMSIIDDGYHLIFKCSDYDVLKEEAIINRLVADGVEGIILYPVQTQTVSRSVQNIIADGYPLVMIDRYPANLEVTSVVSDNYDGAYKIVEHLIKIGHKRIAFVSSRIGNVNTVEERFRGYVSALSDNGISVDESLLFTNYPIKFNFPQDIQRFIPDSYAERVIEELVKNDLNPTAVFAINDYIAIELIMEARQKGISVPDQLAVVGFDDIEFASKLEVPLTTVKTFATTIGQQAARLLLKCIDVKNNGSGVVPAERIVVPIELIIRDSCGIKRKT